MRRGISIILSVIMCLGLVGCNTKQNDNQETYSIGYITDSNGLDIQKNQDVIDGINEAFKNYDFKLDIKQSPSPEKYTESCRTLLYSGVLDLVISNSYTISDNLLSLKKNFKKVHFGLINYEDGTNSSLSISYKLNEPAFLAGVLAAKETKTKKIGIIAGIPSSDESSVAGFISGVRAVNKNIKIILQYVGSYNNTQKGLFITNNQIKNNADIIFSICGASTIGVTQAVEEEKKGTRIINSHYYNDTPKSSTLANIQINYKNSAYYICDAFLYDSFEEKNIKLGISDSVIDLEENKDLVSSDVLKDLNTFRDEISIGGLIIPTSIKKAQSFTYKNEKKRDKKDKDKSKKDSKKSSKKDKKSSKKGAK